MRKVGTKCIAISDLFGIFYVRKPNGAKWDSYYETINALRPLFRDDVFDKAVSGFYLNVAGNFDSVRISYFVNKTASADSLRILKHFFTDNGILEIQSYSAPHEDIIARNYGGIEYEKRFRDFLARETMVGLDLIQENLLNARSLFATYRWQVRKASQSPRRHFEPTFKKHSPTYNAWSDIEKDQFFVDLWEWPNPPQVDWAHMMVNFVLGCDWNNVFSNPCYLTPGNPLSIPEINEVLINSGLDFQIPLDWKP